MLFTSCPTWSPSARLGPGPCFWNTRLLSRKGGWEQASLARLDSGLTDHELAAPQPPCLHGSSFPVFLSLFLLHVSWTRRTFQSSWGCACPEGLGGICPLPTRALSLVFSAQGQPAPFLWPHADLLLCFGSDRFPVGWRPVVCSLSCTDENSPFC